MDKDLLRLHLTGGEGFFLEYKEGVSKDLASELVAFANSRGGKILFGVQDDGAVIGINSKNKNRLKSQIQNTARECNPSIVVHLEEMENVLVATVPEGRDKPYQCKTGFYARIGPNSQKLSRDEIVNLIYTSGHIRWDEQDYTDFPSEQVYDSSLFDKYIKMARISTELSEQHTLVNLRCAHIVGKFQLTNAGYLFFGKLPELATTFAGITCALYKGTKKLSIIDRKEFQKDAISNIEDAMVFLKRVINIRYELPTGELRRKSIPEIPYDALREAVINAVTHRDYTVKGPGTMIEVFDDRVEISNPGGLPASLTPEEFGRRSAPRNLIIADMMFRIEYIEKMGTGIEKMRELCRKASNPEPRFSFGRFFTVIFRKPQFMRDTRFWELPRRTGEEVAEKGEEKTVEKSRNSVEKTKKSEEKTAEKSRNSVEKTEKSEEKTVEKSRNSVEKTEKSEEKSEEKTAMRIIRLMRIQSNITIQELSEEIGITSSGIEKQIAKLKENGKVKRIGADKGGHWEVGE